MKAFIRAMKALSDPNRVKIVKLLAAKELCVCELTALLGVAQSTVSKHLKILEDAGFVVSWRDGAWMNYRLADGRESPYAAAMIRQMKEWLNDDDRIRQVLAHLSKVDRITINAA